MSTNPFQNSIQAFRKILLTLAISATICQPVAGGIISSVQFLTGNTAGAEVLNLASPGQILSNGTAHQFNVINDSDGTKLTTDNGDQPDFTLSGTSTAVASGEARVVIGATGASSPFAAVDSGRIGDQHSFKSAASSNNPGTVISNTFQLAFNSNLKITEASFNFSSLNTAGVTWEYSVIQFLDTNLNPFTPLTGLGSFSPGSASQYATGGFSGTAGTGNFVAASTGTVINVGTTQTSSGTSGTSDNISSFNYALVGLGSGTQIGGIRWSTYLEDVRGTNNGTPNFTSSLFDFTLSGETITAVPEPSSFAIMSLAGLGFAGWHRRQRIRASAVFRAVVE